MLTVYDLKTEHLSHPNAVDNGHPRFSWKLKSDHAGVTQQSYHITVCPEGQPGNVLWDSGVVASAESRFVRYEGKPLQSRMKLSWKVEVICRDEDGKTLSAESDAAVFQMGLLHAKDWQAEWIESDVDAIPMDRRPTVYFKRVFTVRPGLKEARLWQTAHGLYETWFNQKCCTEDKFKPGLTSYYYRIQYHHSDVTDLLAPGENEWLVNVGDGWWRGVTGGTVKNNFGTRLHYLGQLELAYEDGSVEVVKTDDSFLASDGPLLVSDMLMGEVYDARITPSNWKKVHPANEYTNAEKIASRSVPVREKERFDAAEFRDAAGQRVLDFGQNIAGYVRMTLRDLAPGQEVRLVHGESLDPEGNFSVQNISGTPLSVPAFQEITYRAKGETEEIWQPLFAVFGFRYVLVEGYEGEIRPGDFTAIAVYSDMEPAGTFSCSHPGINQLVQNSLWSQKGNFLDVAVDCPTRERNAWTGDAQVYVRTASCFMNVYPFFEKWLYDQKLEQYASGKVGITFPSTSSVHNPEVFASMKRTSLAHAMAGPVGEGHIGEDSCGWGDSAVWLPYVNYLCYGDAAILRQQYDTARRWVDYMLRCAREKNPLYQNKPWYQNGDDADYVWDTRYHYGEWSEPRKPKDYENYTWKKPQIKKESKLAGMLRAGMVAGLITALSKKGEPRVATAYMRRSTANLAQMAAVLGKDADARHYAKVSEKIAEVYDRYFVQEDGRIEDGKQAPYVQTLVMDLCAKEKRPAVLSQLVKEIQNNEMCLNTGFLSTAFLLPVLAENGYTDVAYTLLEQTRCPGWLHEVEMGGTTIFETWGGMEEHSSSLNHYSLGAVCEFLFADVAGIRPVWEDPGYHTIALRPIPGGSLDYAKAEMETPYGTVKSSWKRDETGVDYEFEIPVNTRANVLLPDGQEAKLGSGIHKMRTGIGKEQRC